MKYGESQASLSDCVARAVEHNFALLIPELAQKHNFGDFAQEEGAQKREIAKNYDAEFGCNEKHHRGIKLLPRVNCICQR